MPSTIFLCISKSQRERATLSCCVLMAQFLKLHTITRSQSLLPSPIYASRYALTGNPNPRWAALQQRLKCDHRHSCLFADGRKQEQARKALESALGGKKTEFEKWNKEIQKREERDGGGASGGGGWFGGGGRFGWFGGDHFWDEAQQAIIAIVGIISLYLLLAKGSVMFAVVSNSLLFVLRGTRNWLAFVSSGLAKGAALSGGYVQEPVPESAVANQPKLSAKERVVRKWGMD